jgi:hypothetical protein
LDIAEHLAILIILPFGRILRRIKTAINRFGRNAHGIFSRSYRERLLRFTAQGKRTIIDMRFVDTAYAAFYVQR